MFKQPVKTNKRKINNAAKNIKIDNTPKKQPRGGWRK